MGVLQKANELRSVLATRMNYYDESQSIIPFSQSKLYSTKNPQNFPIQVSENWKTNIDRLPIQGRHWLNKQHHSRTTPSIIRTARINSFNTNQLQQRNFKQ